MLHLHQALRSSLPFSEIVVILCLPPFERHTELNSKNRPLGMIFTCSKIKRSLLNLFVVASLCVENPEESEWYWLEESLDSDEQLSRVKNVFVSEDKVYWIKPPQSELVISGSIFVRLCAFFWLLFFAQAQRFLLRACKASRRVSVANHEKWLACRATPDALELKIQTIEVKHQNMPP